MSVQCEDFLDYAKRFLAKDPCTEMDRRNSSSRAYYYLFHKSKKKFKQDPRTNFNDTGDDHEECINFLRLINELTLANRFHYCRKRRLDADYKINKSFSKYKSDDQIKEIESIAQKIDEIIDEI